MPNPNNRQSLLQAIVAQPEHKEGRALVNVREFFNGNDDLGSIGCNLAQHPGLVSFRRVLEHIQALTTVNQVWLQIYDIEEGEWPFSENVLIFGEVTTAEVAKIATEIEPSEVNEMRMDWIPSRDSTLTGLRYVNLWWD